MNKNLHQNIQRYIASHIHEVTDLICTIASIPSPTGHTEKKAAWVLQYLKNLGIDEAYIDEAGNVIYPHALSQTESSRYDYASDRRQYISRAFLRRQ